MTQSETGELGFTQMVGIVLGAAVVVAVFASFAWFNRRARIARRERPPQKSKLLRPAGYSLQCRIDQLTHKWNDVVTQAIMAGSVLGLLAFAIYPILGGLALRRFTLSEVLTHPKSYILLSTIALWVSATAWLVANIVIATRSQRNLRNCRFGLRGEQAVAEALADSAVIEAGYTVFHDVPGDGKWNIDHVIVGPSGIFVLETKTRARRTPTHDQEDNVVLYDGQRLLFPWCEDRRVVRQIEQNTNWVREFVTGYAPDNVIIQAVIVVPGWYVKSQGSFPVQAMNADYLKKCVAGSKPRYSAEQLRSVSRRLDERCRDLEF